MSYILDALRKADAEREQGMPADPLMAMQPAPGNAPPAPQRPARTWIWLATGAAIPIAALLAWRLLAPGPEPAPRVAIAPPSGDAPPAPTPAAPAASALPALPPAASQVEPAPAIEPVPAPAAEPAPPAAAAEPAPAPAAVKRKPPPRPPAPAKKAEARSPVPKAAEAKSTPAPVRTLAELPEELRRQVPQMTIGGSVYSPQPENRMLVVNGQVVREGTALTPELRLESIGRQTAVFSIRGQRFEVRL